MLCANGLTSPPSFVAAVTALRVLTFRVSLSCSATTREVADLLLVLLTLCQQFVLPRVCLTERNCKPQRRLVRSKSMTGKVSSLGSVLRPNRVDCSTIAVCCERKRASLHSVFACLSASVSQVSALSFEQRLPSLPCCL